MGTVTDIRSCRRATSIATIILNYRFAPKEPGLTWRVHKLLASLQRRKQPAIIHRVTFKKPKNINASSWNRAIDAGMQGTRGFSCDYRYAPHNDVSVNDGPYTWQWSHYIIILYSNIIILTTVLQLPTVFSTVTCCIGL